MTHSKTSKTNEHSTQAQLRTTNTDHDELLDKNDYTEGFDPVHVSELLSAFDWTIPDGEVVNVNVVTDIGRRVDVDALIEDNDTIDIAHKNGGFCELRPNDHGSAKLYGTGRIVLAGVTDARDIINAVDTAHKQLRAAGVGTEWADVELKNLVVNFEPLTDEDGDPKLLDLDKLSILEDNIEYHTPSFPGAIYRNENQGTCILFGTSASVIQGAKSTKGAVEQKEELFTKLDTYGLL